VAGLVTSFGSGAMTNSIAELGDAKCIFAIGTNTTVAHPVLALKVKEAVAKGAALIVANPKEIDLCRHARIVLRHRPGSDVVLLMGMMKVIIDEGLEDRDYIAARCEDFDAFRESLSGFGLEYAEKITGVPKEDIAQAARLYATNKPAAALYAMGITQHSHGTDNVMAVANLALLTGSVGKPSSGVNPLRGQNNVQGACDVGGLPNVYPGYQQVANPEVKAKFEAAWGCRLDDKPGLTHMEILDAVDDGRVKTVYMVGENPILSEANANHVQKSLEKLDFLVCQDIFLTETAQLADVVLPAASFAEKDGTFTNTERRVQRVRKAIDPPGDARTDSWIVAEIAKRMGADGFEFSDAGQIMAEIASLTPSYGGISYDRLEENGLQWPCPTPDHPGTPFLHRDRFARPGGKARFVPLEYKPSAELPDDQYPLLLTTDRSIFHFHTATMTRKTGLEQLHPEESLAMHPATAAAYEICDGDLLRVESRRGEMNVRARVTDACLPGVVSSTFHFFESPVNKLTSAARDPVAKIPETKVCAVRVEKIAEPVKS
jgi:formate dehydrogenase alpha subunit